MTRRSRTAPNPGLALLLGLVVLGLLIAMIKWLLITTAILAVPFGIWWYLDREKQKAAANAGTSAAAPAAQPAPRPSTDETDWRARYERAERELAEARRGLSGGYSRDHAIARGREITARIMGEKRR